MTTAPTTERDRTVLDYLDAIWAQSADLRPGLREDLMATVSDYIATHRRATGDPAEVVRWLGPPEILVAAIRRGQLPRP